MTDAYYLEEEIAQRREHLRRSGEDFERALGKAADSREGYMLLRHICQAGNIGCAIACEPGAVAMRNYAAEILGRLAAANPQACSRLLLDCLGQACGE